MPDDLLAHFAILNFDEMFKTHATGTHWAILCLQNVDVVKAVKRISAMMINCHNNLQHCQCAMACWKKLTTLEQEFAANVSTR